MARTSQQDRIAIFIDGNSLFHAARSHNVEINYEGLFDFLVDEDPLIRAIFYTGVRVDKSEEATKQKRFLTWMSHNGYALRTRPLRQHRDSYRANLSVDIATDMLMAAAGKAETIILVGGDDIYHYPLEQIKNMGVRVEVAMFSASTANSLIRVADDFIDLGDQDALDKVAKDPSKFGLPSNSKNYAYDEDDDYEDEYEDEYEEVNA